MGFRPFYLLASIFGALSIGLWALQFSGWLGLPYSQARLTNWEYNAALGTRYLAMLQEMFGSSPVLIAAGYNAGPGRPWSEGRRSRTR